MLRKLISWAAAVALAWSPILALAQEISQPGTGGSSGGGAVTAGACLGGGGSTPTTLFGTAQLANSGAQITGTYVVVAADACKLAVFNSASPFTVTVPAIGTAGFSSGYGFDFINIGAGTVTLQSASNFEGSSSAGGTLSSITAITGRAGTITVDPVSSVYAASACTACIAGGVTGPLASLVGNIPTFSVTNGQTLQDSGVNITGNQLFLTSGVFGAPGLVLNGTNTGLFGSSSLGQFTAAGTAMGFWSNTVWGVGPSVVGSRTVSDGGGSNVTMTFEVANSVSTLGRAGISVSGYVANPARPSMLALAHANSNTLGTNTAVGSADQLGLVSFQGADGTNMVTAAQLKCNASGTVSTAQVPATCILATANATGTVTSAQSWDQAQHIYFGGPKPSIGTGSGDCGTTPTNTGNDNAGAVTVGSSVNGGVCTVTFAASWTIAPICTVNNNTAVARVVGATSVGTGSFKITAATTLTAADVLTYRCEGTL